MARIAFGEMMELLAIGLFLSGTALVGAALRLA